jgi:hypothetical protein
VTCCIAEEAGCWFAALWDTEPGHYPTSTLQEEFYRLESRLQTAYIMLLAAMGVQDQVRRYANKAECVPCPVTRTLSRRACST